MSQGSDRTGNAVNHDNTESRGNQELSVVSMVELSHEADLASLPELPPGVAIPAPSRVPRQRTRWPDAIDVIFEKDPACGNIFEAVIYPGLWALLYHRVAHALYNMHIPFIPRLISQFARF